MEMPRKYVQLLLVHYPICVVFLPNLKKTKQNTNTKIQT